MIAAPILLVSFLFFLYQSWVYSSGGKIQNRKGRTGGEVARQLLSRNGFQDVPVEMIMPLNHDSPPSFRQLYLSPGIYEGKDLWAIAGAAREAARLALVPSSVLPLRVKNRLSFLLHSVIFIAWGTFLLGLTGKPFEFFKWTGSILFILLFVLALLRLPREWEVSEKAFFYLRQSQWFDLDEFIRLKRILRALRLSLVSQIFRGPFLVVKNLAVHKRAKG